MIFYHQGQKLTVSLHYCHTARTAKGELYSIYRIELIEGDRRRELRVFYTARNRRVTTLTGKPTDEINSWGHDLQGSLQRALKEDHCRHCYDVTITNCHDMANNLTHCILDITEKDSGKQWQLRHNGIGRDGLGDLSGLEPRVRGWIKDMAVCHWELGVTK